MPSNSAIKILVVNESGTSSSSFPEGFNETGLALEGITVPQKTFPFIDACRPDVIIIDNAAPLEVVKSVRQRDTYDRISIVVTSPLSSETEILEAFEMGVDEYLPHPQSQAVLYARLKNLNRRRSASSEESLAEILILGPLKMNASSLQTYLDGKSISLTLTEFRLLKDLAANTNKVRTRENLRTNALNNLHVNDRTIDVHIASLRKKLGDFGRHIRTVRGLGYRLVL